MAVATSNRAIVAQLASQKSPRRARLVYHSPMQNVDIVIVGGGLVGSCMACALEGLGGTVAHVEAEPWRSQPEPRWDERCFALARRSVQALDAWGIWRHLGTAPVPLRGVHVSSRGDLGAVRIHAEDCGLDALGCTVPARDLVQALRQRLRALRDTQVFSPARVTGAVADENGITIAVCDAAGSTTQLRASLLIAADGTDSGMRERLGIACDTYNYQQTALVTALELNQGLQGWAYERFADDGPMALLPLSGNRAGLVWSMPDELAAERLTMDAAAFLQLANAQWGLRLGRFQRLGQRQPWPLRLVAARSIVAPRALLIGNAAQTIHPIGAQGFNLGLRDVLAVQGYLAQRAPLQWGQTDTLAEYAASREADRRATIEFSDGLARWSRQRSRWPGWARSLGLLALERMPGSKREIAYQRMGYGP